MITREQKIPCFVGVPGENTGMDFRVYVRAIVFNEKRQILMLQKRSDQKIAPGRWLLPGGAVEFNETAEQALRREIQEETGMIAQEVKLLGEDVRIIEQTHWHGLIYLVRGSTDSVYNVEPHKHAALQWHSLDFVKPTLSPSELRVLESLLSVNLA